MPVTATAGEGAASGSAVEAGSAAEAASRPAMPFGPGKAASSVFAPPFSGSTANREAFSSFLAQPEASSNMHIIKTVSLFIG